MKLFQVFYDFFGIGSGLHQIDSCTVDLTADLDLEIAIGTCPGGVWVSSHPIGVGFAGKFQFDIVTDNGGKDLAIPQVQGQHVVVGIDSDVKADAVPILNGVVTASGQKKHGCKRHGHKGYDFHFSPLFFLHTAHSQGEHQAAQPNS